MSVIHVVGLGPSDMSGIPLGTYEMLTSSMPVVVRTRIHPAVTDLEERGMTFDSFDDLYETGISFEEVYHQMAQKLFDRARTHGDLVYAVPGHPLIAEQSVQNLLAMNPDDVIVKIGPGQSFMDAIFTRLRIDPIEGFLLLDGCKLIQSELRPTTHTLIAQVFQKAIASEVKLTLMNVYPDDYPITVVHAAGVLDEERIEIIPLFEIDRLEHINHLTTLYVPPTEREEIHMRDPWFVTSLVERLRAPGGCPWDRKQTHETLRPYVLEEAYEVAHAIDTGDSFDLSDELGDLLLQVLLHAQIGSEFGEFSIRDVYEALASKIIRRHPHVFGSTTASTEEEAQASWNAVKMRESIGSDDRSILSGVKRGLPAFMVAREMQQRAGKVGFDWTSVDDVLRKVKEEINEVEQEVQDGHVEEAFQELGDLLFSIVNLARWLDVDPEAALASSIQKFENRFQHVEESVIESGKSWEEHGLDDLDELWNQAKSLETVKISRNSREKHE